MAIDINALYGSLTDNELVGLSSAREINAAFPITRNGVVYNFLPDGAIETIAPTDATLEGRSTGATLGLFSPTGEAIVEPYFNESYGETSGSQMLGQTLLAAGLGAMFGPAGFGLSTPAAAAAGSGWTAFGTSGGDVEAALRAAALAGATAYGIESLFSGASTASVDPDVAVDVANLAAQGVPEEQIAQILSQEGVASEVINSALDAQFGVSAPGSARGLEFTTAPSGAEQVPVASQASQAGLLSTAAPAIAPAATGLLGAQSFPVPSESVQVQTTTQPADTQVAAPAAAVGGLLAPTQTVPVQATSQQLTPDEASSIVSALSGQPVSVAGQQVQVTGQTSQQISPDNAAALISAATGQQVTVAGQTAGQQSNTSGAEVAGLLATPSTPPASERVTVEDRPIRREEAQILTPVVTGAVAGVPVADVAVPRSSTGPIEGSTSINPLATAGLLALGASALTGGGSTGTPFDQAAYDAIARGRSPVYPRGDFTPIFGPGGEGMFQIAPTDVYNYFGPYYGAGRFGATVQPFSLPGLLGPNTGLLATPSRSAAV